MVGYAAGGLTTIAFLPQVVKAWRTRSTEDLSLGMLLVFTLGVALWVLYGLMLDEAPIVLFNVLTLALALALLALKLGGGRSA